MISDNSSKNDYRNAVIDIIDFLKPYCSKGSTRILVNVKNSQYDDAAAREGFSKILWAVIPFIKGGGKDVNIEELYRMGTVNGTNPSSNEYWGKCRDFDRRFQEMAPIACGLLMNPDIIFYLFSKKERQDIVDWLYNINLYKCGEGADQFLVILVNSALRLLGRPYDKNKLGAAFDYIEKMYIGDGWYGFNGIRNFNVTLTIQYYSLIYAKTMMDYDGIKCNEYINRAELFLKDLYKNKLFIKNSENIGIFGFCAACFYAEIEIKSMDILRIMKESITFYSSKINNWCYKYINAISCNSNSVINNYYSNYITWYMKIFMVLTLPNDHSFWKVS